MSFKIQDEGKGLTPMTSTSEGSEITTYYHVCDMSNNEYLIKVIHLASEHSSYYLCSFGLTALWS